VLSHTPSRTRTLTQRRIIAHTHTYLDNEPSYESQAGTKQGIAAANQYDANVRNKTIEIAMLDQLASPPVGFEYLTLAHFYLQRDAIMKMVRGWAKDGVSKGKHLTLLKELIPKLDAALSKLKMPAKPVDDASDDDTDDDEYEDDEDEL
jgi:hypothetical protein